MVFLSSKDGVEETENHNLHGLFKKVQNKNWNF